MDAQALKRIDPLNAQATLKKSGKVVQTATHVISKDGKVLTLTFKGTNAQGQASTTCSYSTNGNSGCQRLNQRPQPAAAKAFQIGFAETSHNTKARGGLATRKKEVTVYLTEKKNGPKMSVSLYIPTTANRSRPF